MGNRLARTRLPELVISLRKSYEALYETIERECGCVHFRANIVSGRIGVTKIILDERKKGTGIKRDGNIIEFPRAAREPNQHNQEIDVNDPKSRRQLEYAFARLNARQKKVHETKQEKQMIYRNINLEIKGIIAELRSLESVSKSFSGWIGGVITRLLHRERIDNVGQRCLEYISRYNEIQAEAARNDREFTELSERYLREANGVIALLLPMVSPRIQGIALEYLDEEMIGAVFKTLNPEARKKAMKRVSND